MDTQAVEHADVALVRGDGDVALLCGGGGGEIVLADVLLELGVDELVAGQTGIDTVEGVLGETEEGLLAGRLSELVLRGEDVDGDVVVNLPLVDNLAVLQVHTVQAVRVVGVLHHHVAVFHMQHDLLGGELLA